MYGRKSCSACGGREYRSPQDACGRCADFGSQVGDWLAQKCPPSIAGQKGHDAAYVAACAVVGGFGCGEAEAVGYLAGWNAGCVPPWSERELLHKVKEAGKAGAWEKSLVWVPWQVGESHGRDSERAELPPEAPGRVELKGNRMDFDYAKLQALQTPNVVVDRAFLQSKSLCDLRSVTPEFFLSSLYPAGSRLLVFTSFQSQGQFLWQVPGAAGEVARDGSWRLGRTREDKAERAVGGLPRTGRCGVWMLNQPVDGKWHEKEGSAKWGAGPEWTRRSGNCVTDWPYMVVESDIKGIKKEWLNFLAGLAMPIVAMYTSGGKSVHALVKIGMSNGMVTRHHFELVRDRMKPLLTACGADPAVFTPVRLTRLPGCLRHGTEDKGGYRQFDKPVLQELLYFNPRAEWGDGGILGKG